VLPATAGRQLATRTYREREALATRMLHYTNQVLAVIVGAVRAILLAYADVADVTAVEVPGLTMQAYMRLSSSTQYCLATGNISDSCCSLR
jgi:hypothetical protein